MLVDDKNVGQIIFVIAAIELLASLVAMIWVMEG